jgi:hypothetical protein
MSRATDDAVSNYFEPALSKYNPPDPTLSGSYTVGQPSSPWWRDVLAAAGLMGGQKASPREFLGYTQRDPQSPQPSWLEEFMGRTFDEPDFLGGGGRPWQLAATVPYEEAGTALGLMGAAHSLAPDVIPDPAGDLINFAISHAQGDLPAAKRYLDRLRRIPQTTNQGLGGPHAGLSAYDPALGGAHAALSNNPPTGLIHAVRQYFDNPPAMFLPSNKFDYSVPTDRERLRDAIEKTYSRTWGLLPEQRRAEFEGMDELFPK